MLRAGLGELNSKAGHGMREPKLPSFGVIGGHAHSLLGAGMEFVEEVSIHACAGCDDEEARAGLALEVEKLYATERDPAGDAVQSNLRRRSDIHGQAEVVRECIGGAHGQNREGGASVRQHLNHIVDGAVSTASKNRVITCKNGLARFLLGMGARVGEDKVGLYVCGAEQRQHGLQLGLAPYAAAAGIRVVE